MKKKKTFKPWGFEQLIFTCGKARVKKLVIRPGRRTSLQSHSHTPETWMVVKGHPAIELHGERNMYVPGSSFSVGEDVPHRIAAIYDTVVIIEVKYGSDADIVRHEDDYGR